MRQIALILTQEKPLLEERFTTLSSMGLADHMLNHWITARTYFQRESVLMAFRKRKEKKPKS